VAVDDKAPGNGQVKYFGEATIMSDNLMTRQTQDFPHEEIAFRAHSLWEERGCPIGSPEEDWSRAEQAVREDVIRARNKAVRTHRHAPEAGVAPPFSDHSGSL
jgi:hypothetical protein